MCFSDPNSHPYISDKEKEYLLKHMGRLGRDHNLPPFPWVPVFKSKEMWVLILAQVAHDWGFYVMSSCFPKFLNDVLQLQILKTGLYSSIPFLLFWLSSLLLGAIADYIIKRDLTRATCVRKWMTFIGKSILKICCYSYAFQVYQFVIISWATISTLNAVRGMKYFYSYSYVFLSIFLVKSYI